VSKTRCGVSEDGIRDALRPFASVEKIALVKEAACRPL